MITQAKPRKVVLVSAGVSRGEYSEFSRFLPMAAPGIYYNAAILRQQGWDVTIIDQPNKNLTDRQVLEKIRAAGADYVLFNQFFSTRERIRGMVKNLRESGSECIIGVGGHDATFNSCALQPEVLASAYNGFDFIFRGESEPWLPLTLKRMERTGEVQIVGDMELEFRVGGYDINRIGALDSLPILEHDYDGDTGFLVTSRGCPNACSFCTTPSMYADGWRARSVEHILPELDNLVKAGKKYVFIFDDNFLGGGEAGLERGQRIIEACKARGLKVMIMTSAKQIVKAEQAGYLAKWTGTVYRVFVGLENGDEEAAKALGCCSQKQSREQSMAAVNALRENGMALFSGYINFNAQSTFGQLKNSANFLLDTGEAAVFTNLCQNLRPYDGTRISEEYKDRNLSIEGREYTYTFTDSRVGEFAAYLASLRPEGTDKLDNIIFELTGYIYINQLQNEKLGQRYQELRDEVNRANYEFFMACLRSFEQGAPLPSQDSFLAQSNEFLERCELLKSDIMGAPALYA